MNESGTIELACRVKSTQNSMLWSSTQQEDVATIGAQAAYTNSARARIENGAPRRAELAGAAISSRMYRPTGEVSNRFGGDGIRGGEAE